MKAIQVNSYQGRKFYRFPVQVTFGQYAAVAQVFHYPKVVLKVIAPSARAACDLLSDELEHIPCVELEAFGPQGGRAAHRYWGWDRATFCEMNRAHDRSEREARQLRLTFNS